MPIFPLPLKYFWLTSSRNLVQIINLIRFIDFTCTLSGLRIWSEIMGILNEKDALGDEEILVFSMTLVNKVT